jgi:hypothetical protein
MQPPSLCQAVAFDLSLSGCRRVNLGSVDSSRDVAGSRAIGDYSLSLPRIAPPFGRLRPTLCLVLVDEKLAVVDLRLSLRRGC